MNPLACKQCGNTQFKVTLAVGFIYESNSDQLTPTERASEWPTMEHTDVICCQCGANNAEEADGSDTQLRKAVAEAWDEERITENDL